MFTPGKQTNFFTRFSGIFTEQGDADTSRDPRGFAIKFYTEEGNWDLLGINTPVFSLRDAKLGPDNVHAFKRDPRTGMWNANQFWDYVANHPESLHQIAMLYTDRTGTPMSFRTMNAYGCHTFSFVNCNNERFWVKFHILSMQGARGFSLHEAKAIAGEDPNFLARDLKQAIDNGNFPKWKLFVQIMPEAEAYKHTWTFDATKVWKHKDYPLIEIGTLEVNKNPIDYFTEVEQAAFSPATVVPGIGLSPDKLLQGRLLIYDDTQHRRIGDNFKQLPVNRPLKQAESNVHYLGGHMRYDIKNQFPHYHTSVYGGPQPNASYEEPPFKTDGHVAAYDYPGEGTDDDYYGQVRDFWNILPFDQRDHLCMNMAASFEKIVDSRILSMMMSHISAIHPQWSKRVQEYMAQRQTLKSPNEQICERYAKELLNMKASSV